MYTKTCIARVQTRGTKNVYKNVCEEKHVYKNVVCLVQKVSE